MEIGGSTTRHFWPIKETIGRGCGISNTNRGGKVLCGGKCQWRGNRCCFVTGTGWKMVPCHLFIQIPHGYRMKLQNLQQRITCHHACTRWMETLPDGSSSGFQKLDGSPKPPVFLKTSEAKPTTSMLGDRTSWISLLSASQTRHGKQESQLA